MTRFSGGGAMLALSLAAAAPAWAQDGPVGMVDQPCPAPAAEGAPPPAREEIMRRARNDWGGLCRHRDANARLEGQAVRAVFIGDSITEGWAAAAPELFSGGVVNRGIGAQTSPQMLVRFYQDVIALKPAVVHIMAGTNDVAGNTGPSRPEDYRNHVRAMAELARAHGIAVILGSIPPAAAFYWRPELRPAARIAELNAWLRGYAAENGFGFIDYHAAMAGPDGEMRQAFSSDGVHPDAAGYAVMTQLAQAALAEAARPTAQ